MKLNRLVIALGFMVLAIDGYGHENIDKKVISTALAPQAIGPYSQAIEVGNTVYLAGQIAINPKTGKIDHKNIEGQTHQVLKNIQAVLKAAGYSLDNIIQSQVYLTNLDHYQSMNHVYSGYFKQAAPVRAVVEVSRLPRNALIEIMVTAVK
ncbi:MAG: 2-iminobutanoate/2-iminopropanoate deaminase [Pseudohongiellaceae bacterium]|jgi:2-iminobutanoate/2-iminopropanoate deaminase